MSRREDSITLRQMLDHIEEARSLAGDRSRSDLETDRMFFLAMLKLVEIVGEAANRVSEVTRTAQAGIPWREIIGTRNRLVHGYDSIDLDILWDIVNFDFPSLAEKLRAILPKT